MFLSVGNLLGGSSLDGPFYLEQTKKSKVVSILFVIYTTAGYSSALLPEAQICPPDDIEQYLIQGAGDPPHTLLR
jgi:hypothetical protein